MTDYNKMPPLPNPGPDSLANVNDFPEEPVQDIVSVNKKGSAGDNKVAKALFILVVGSILVGSLVYLSQKWLNERKAAMKANNAPKVSALEVDLFNPEKTGSTAPRPKLGSDSGAPVVAAAPSPAVRPGAPRDVSIRTLLGADGKPLVNPQGRAIGVDPKGNMVEVPAITAVMDDPVAKKPLPGQQVATNQGLQQPKSPSRFGGSLFVGEAVKPVQQDSAESASQSAIQQYIDYLKSAGVGPAGSVKPTGQGMGNLPPFPTPFGAQPAPAPLSLPGQPPQQDRPGTLGTTLISGATPVALAKRLSNQNLILPKGRQADCILTGRISDEVPGFTSCVLAQNMYSDNGRVLLLERGSELTGEYGVSNQLGSERLFVTWLRVKTPEGIEVDISSPGTDRLGTSGLLGHLDNRWGARIGASLLLSFVKDITVAVINNQSKNSAAATSVSITTGQPGQNTLNAGSALAEEVIKQTLKIRPRLTINEGDRIAVYVARDLDFAPVYALKTNADASIARVLTP